MIFLDQTYMHLCKFGVSANYKGCYFAVYAVSLCLEQPERLLLVTKWLYPDVARHFGTNWKAVERNLRTVSTVAWQSNRQLLERLLHKSLPNPPTVTEFLAMLCREIAPDFAADATPIPDAAPPCPDTVPSRTDPVPGPVDAVI